MLRNALSCIPGARFFCFTDLPPVLTNVMRRSQVEAAIPVPLDGLQVADRGNRAECPLLHALSVLYLLTGFPPVLTNVMWCREVKDAIPVPLDGLQAAVSTIPQTAFSQPTVTAFDLLRRQAITPCGSCHGTSSLMQSIFLLTPVVDTLKYPAKCQHQLHGRCQACQLLVSGNQSAVVRVRFALLCMVHKLLQPFSCSESMINEAWLIT